MYIINTVTLKIMVYNKYFIFSFANNIVIEKTVCIYIIYHMFALQMQNTSESDPRSCEATKAVAKKVQKKL